MSHMTAIDGGRERRHTCEGAVQRAHGYYPTSLHLLPFYNLYTRFRDAAAVGGLHICWQSYTINQTVPKLVLYWSHHSSHYTIFISQHIASSKLPFYRISSTHNSCFYSIDRLLCLAFISILINLAI